MTQGNELEKAKELYKTANADQRYVLEKLFPKLVESEDWIPKEIIKYLKEKGDFRSCWITWLKKQSEQKPAWSEEDEREVAVLEAYIRSKDWSERHIDRALGIVDELVNKAKSLRPQNTWKPREEQIEALESATENCAYSEYQDCLRELMAQLKKLREE